MSQIGQLNEQHLHAGLKAHYAQQAAQTEVMVDGYIIDVVQNGLLIEIQTKNFHAIKKKMTNLVSHHPVRLVFPIAVEKWLLKLPVAGGQGGQRRKSPKRGRPVAVFAELVSFPKLLIMPNFSLELALTQEEEVRRYTGKKSWRKNGWQTVERKLIKVVDQKRYSNPGELAGLLPTDLPETFTTSDIASALHIPRWLAQKMAYCFREMGAIQLIGKQSRSSLYSMSDKAE